MLNVHSYESFGTFDGPGIRLVVFLQGCSFRCIYCANPDTISLTGGNPTDYNYILQMAINQKPFFGNKGGVTISGGEPLLQAKELIPLFKELHKNGINTCIDTNGSLLNEDVKELLRHTDLVLLDIKHINEEIHKQVTGCSVKNPLLLAQYLEENAHTFWLRYVLVPEYTDQEQYLNELGNYFKDYKHLKQMEIQPYHRLGTHKWEYLGWEYKLQGVPDNNAEQINKAKEIFQKYFEQVIVN